MKLIEKINKKFLYFFNKKKMKEMTDKLEQKSIDNLKRLGSVYGGWYFQDKKSLQNSTIISCGLGEDASFDVEFINYYKGKVIFVDPTPAAIKHFKEILNSLGNKKSENYKKIGKQRINSYDLSQIENNQLLLINKAIYKTNGEEINFYRPPDKNHVSHSLNDWQNNYKKTGEHIIVETITLEKIMEENSLKNLNLLKLDIEGAEIEVIKSTIGSKIFPNQICVEFDELHKFNNTSKNRFLEIYNLLKENSYDLIKTDEHPNFLFIRAID